MAFVRVEQRNAHLAGAVRLNSVEGRDGPISKATLTAISNTRRGSGDNRGEEATAIQWTLWGKQAENAAQYLGKGSHINVVGRVQNNNYDRDGETVYTMAFTAEEIDYLDTKAEGEAIRAKQGTDARGRGTRAGCEASRPRPLDEAGPQPQGRRQGASRRRNRRHPVLTKPGGTRGVPPLPTPLIEGTDMYCNPDPRHTLRTQHLCRAQRDTTRRGPDAPAPHRRSSPPASTPAAPSATPTSRPSKSCAGCARRASSPSWSRRARAASKARPSSRST